jgi:hypothetical protein
VIDYIAADYLRAELLQGEKGKISQSDFGDSKLLKNIKSVNESLTCTMI